jgi:hypothetical protein
MTEYTTDQMVSCVEREIAMRKRVYPSRTANGRMTKAKAEYEIGCMAAVLEILKDRQQKEQLL